MTASLNDAAVESHAGATKIALDGERDRRPVDRYALAGGCYAVKSAATGAYLTRTSGGFAATAAQTGAAEPLHLQAFDLGKYLLFATRSDFLAMAGDPTRGGAHPAADSAEGYARGTGDESLNSVRQPLLHGADAAVAASDTVTQAGADVARGDGIVAAAQPSSAAEWVVKPAGGGAFTLEMAVDDHSPADPGPLDPPIAGTLTAGSDGRLAVVKGESAARSARFTFELRDGCAVWPEIEVNVSGPYPAGQTAYGDVTGYVDAHLHGMAFEFLGGRARCARPWHPYGVTYALVDCPDHEPGGRGAVLESVLSGGNPATGHDTVGWPTFGYWPHYSSLTHEQVYYKWLERSWRGGLRMFTNLLVDNGVLCEIYPYKKNSCNEMDGVRLQAKRIRQFERYIDAQSGGPGKGWFRIVTDPFQARRVINAGKLAVVLGIEVSVPLDCGETLGTPRCTADQIDQRMQEVYDLGVRQMELTNKFDNALTGVTGDDGATGVLVNAGNKYETGHFWQFQTCDGSLPGEDSHDHAQYNIADESGGQVGRDAIFGAVLQVSGGSGAAPVYPAGPHCNTIGFSDLGRHALDAMMKRGMIFDPDHMSAIARKEALDYVAEKGYAGLVSSHSWADTETYRRITEAGGMVTPHSVGAQRFVDEWKQLKSWAKPGALFGIGYGSDVNGFSAQPGPRDPSEESQKVHYPFRGMGGVVIDKQVSGKRTYDVNTDGVDHYGLYPDWVEDARIVAGAAGDEFLADMQRGAEAFLQVWERATGIAPNACRPDVPDLTDADLARVRPGMSPQQVLEAVGQPGSRTGGGFAYCTTAGRATVTFGGTGFADERDARVTRVTG